MEKDRQKELQETLLGVGADKKPFPPQHYTQLSMQDLILLRNMAAIYTQNTTNNPKQKLFFAQRTGFFENHIMIRLWGLEECYLLVRENSQVMMTQRNETTKDVQIFLFSTKELAQKEVERLSTDKEKVEIKVIPHGQFPSFFLNLFPRGVTAIVLDHGQNAVGLPVWAICRRLKDEFVSDASRSAVHLWIQKEMYMLYSTLTNLPYVECDSETFDDLVYVYPSKDEADAAIKDFEIKKIPVRAELIHNRDFRQHFLNLYLQGVNAVKTPSEGIIQLNHLVQKPDYSNLEESKKPVLNPELLLTAVYVCQEERRPEGDKDTDELKQMKEELFTHLREGILAMPVFVTEESEKGQVRFPLITLTNGENYCPVFTDIQTAAAFEMRETARLKEKGEEKPQYKYLKLPFDKILQTLPEQIHGVIINPNMINLTMKKMKK